MHSIRTCLVATLGLAMPVEAEAPRALQALVNSPGYQGNLARLFAKLPPAVFQRCSTLVSTGSQITVINPVTFASDGYPTGGLWKQSFPVSGCGNDTTINLYFRGQPDEKITSIVAIPGQTHADLILQRDAAVQLQLAIVLREKNCTDIAVKNSIFDGYAGGGKPSARSPWTETWTAIACGHTFRIPLAFVPDATGTTVTAKSLPPVD